MDPVFSGSTTNWRKYGDLETQPAHVKQRLPPANISFQELTKRREDYMRKYHEERTKSSHNTAWGQWVLFKATYSDAPSYPTSGEWVANFATWLAVTGYNPSTISQYISGIGQVYQSLGFNNWSHIRQDVGLKLVLGGIEKDRDLKKKCDERKKPQITLDLESINMILERTKEIGMNEYDTQLFRTILVTGFCQLHRLDELTDSDNALHRRPHKDRRILLSSVKIPKEGRYVEYTLPGSKSDPKCKGSKIIIKEATTGPCPLKEFLKYLKTRRAIHPHRKELYVKMDGKIPRRSWFMDRLRYLSGKETIGSKSLRAGGASMIAASGEAETNLKLRGRWTSNAYKRYVKDPTEIRKDWT
jgi:hypothetical protein